MELVAVTEAAAAAVVEGISCHVKTRASYEGSKSCQACVLVLMVLQPRCQLLLLAAVLSPFGPSNVAHSRYRCLLAPLVLRSALRLRTYRSILLFIKVFHPRLARDPRHSFAHEGWAVPQVEEAAGGRAQPNTLPNGSPVVAPTPFMDQFLNPPACHRMLRYLGCRLFRKSDTLAQLLPACRSMLARALGTE